MPDVDERIEELLRPEVDGAPPVAGVRERAATIRRRQRWQRGLFAAAAVTVLVSLTFVAWPDAHETPVDVVNEPTRTTFPPPSGETAILPQLAALDDLPPCGRGVSFDGSTMDNVVAPTVALRSTPISLGAALQAGCADAAVVADTAVILVGDVVGGTVLYAANSTPDDGTVVSPVHQVLSGQQVRGEGTRFSVAGRLVVTDRPSATYDLVLAEPVALDEFTRYRQPAVLPDGYARCLGPGPYNSTTYCRPDGATFVIEWDTEARGGTRIALGTFGGTDGPLYVVLRGDIENPRAVLDSVPALAPAVLVPRSGDNDLRQLFSAAWAHARLIAAGLTVAETPAGERPNFVDYEATLGSRPLDTTVVTRTGFFDTVNGPSLGGIVTALALDDIDVLVQRSADYPDGVQIALTCGQVTFVVGNLPDDEALLRSTAEGLVDGLDC